MEKQDLVILLFFDLVIQLYFHYEINVSLHSKQKFSFFSQVVQIEYICSMSIYLI